MNKRNDEWQEAVNVLIRALENIAQSMCDDYVKTNAQFRSSVGLKPKIIRRTHGETCEWCQRLAGTYPYGEEPHEVYQRHDNCDCTVEYVTEKGSQNVHTKQVTQDSAERVRKARAAEAATAEADAAAREQRIAASKASALTTDAAPDRIEARKQIGSENTGSAKDLSHYIGQPIIKTDNQSVREWYYANVADIPNQVDRTKGIEEQARQAFALRNKYKHEARAAMSDVATAAELDLSRPAPEFDQLLRHKIVGKGMTKEKAIEDILRTASTTNSTVDKRFGL